jgi:hypothetical protein
LNRPLRRASSGVLALIALCAALFLAAHHPLSPALAVAAVLAFFVFELRLRGCWLFVLPAALPALDLSPWSGWSVFDEFDLLALALLAAGHARLAGSTRDEPTGSVGHRWQLATAGLFGLLTLLALARGASAAGGWSFGWFQGYTDPMNGLRVAKSTLYVVLAWPLLLREIRADEGRALGRFAFGMLCGLGLVSLAVVSERAAYPGLWNMGARYRTTAWFWEMRVGGGAIDAYLALATPLVAWALWASRRPLRWLAAALLALVAAYACLTTFSRGLYIALAASLLLLALVLLGRRRDLGARGRWRRATRITLANSLLAMLLVVAFARRGYPGIAVVLLALGVALAVWLAAQARATVWRVAAGVALTAALMVEAVAVLGAQSFMLTRMTASYDDYASRLEHWAAGLATLKRAGDWLFGRGLGRVPALYAGGAAEFSGDVTMVLTPEGALALRIDGPASSPRLGGLFGATQRVALQSGYRARLDLRAPRASDLLMQVCERHLLYDKRCQGAFVRLSASAEWQRIELALRGPPLRAGELLAGRWAVFELSVVNPRGTVELRRVSLVGADGAELLANGDFSRGLARWQTAAQEYFVPWHIDSLYLEILVERGVLALFAFVALAAMALRNGLACAAPSAPFLAAALFGALVVGAVSSVFDAPRVAFALQLLVALLLAADRARNHAPRDLLPHGPHGGDRPATPTP